MSKVKSQWDGSADKGDYRKNWWTKDGLNSIPIPHNGRIKSIPAILWPQHTHTVKYRCPSVCAHTCKSTHAHNKWRFSYKLSNVKLMDCFLIESTKSPFEEISFLFVQKIYLWLRNSSWDGEILAHKGCFLGEAWIGHFLMLWLSSTENSWPYLETFCTLLTWSLGVCRGQKSEMQFNICAVHSTDSPPPTNPPCEKYPQCRDGCMNNK